MGVGSTGPEPLYAAMTSGNAGTIRGLGADAGDAMGDVRDCIELIRYAQDRPEWDSDSARRSYNMRAWATRASSEVCFNRLNRVKLSLGMAADGYDYMDQRADDIIRWWRREKPYVTDALGMYLLMFQAVSHLGNARADYTADLTEAADFLHTDPFSTEEQDWLQRGLVKSMLRDLEHGTMPGPLIPETMATGQDDRAWTPQGLGYDPETGNLIQTSYYEVGEPPDRQVYAQLSIIDPDSGEVINTVELGALDNDTPPDHAGGVVVHDGIVYVSSSDSPARLIPYSMADLTSASPTSVVAPHGVPQEVAAGASSTISGNTMYVGTFEQNGPGEMYTYTWDKESKSWSNEQGPFEIPPQTQGIGVRGNEIVFSTSWGRDKGSHLSSYNLGDVTSGGTLGDPLQTVDLPNMSEGVVMLPGGIVSTHESGSSPYSFPKNCDLDDMWAGTNMTVTPYDELGLSGHIEVVPATLQAASAWFADAERGLDKAERRTGRLTLPSSSLGEVPGADSFASTVRTHLDNTATWLGESRLSADTTASGLIAAANDYEETDAGSDGLFGFLQRFVS